MGSYITLGIGKFEIDWGKNQVFREHSVLFKTTDITQTPYYHEDDSDEIICEMREGYARNLGSVKKRLDLLGYDMQSVRTLYDDLVNEYRKNEYAVNFPFEFFYNVICEFNVSEEDTTVFDYENKENGYWFGEYVGKCILKTPYFKNKLLLRHKEAPLIDPEYMLENFLESIDPYIILRILAENPKNEKEIVYWDFHDIVDNGYVCREHIVKELESTNKILIITEGSSDSFIIKKALEELYPEISDFFEFIDLEENYPFSGVGELYKFCSGLCKIHIQNQTMVIFDNDTTGIEKYEQALSLDIPKNMLITKLPDMPEFKNMQTIGPQGYSMEDINGKAVAIECFLDFKSVQKEASIRWKSYSERQKKYQGELVGKGEYVTVFKKAKLKDGEYDTQKLRKLIDYLIKQWINR